MSESAGRPRTDAASKRMVGRDAEEAAVEFFGLALDLEHELADCRKELEQWKCEAVVRRESHLASHADIRGPQDGGYPFASPAGPDALAEERPDRLTQQQTIDMLADEIESGARKWETANGDIQIRFYSRFEVVSLIAALRSRPAQDRDAERYRWLRGPNLIVSLQFAWPEVTVPQNVGQGIEAACDAAIDAAMSQQEPK